MAIAVKPPPADDSLSDNLCWLLARASHSLTNQLTAALADLGLSPRAHCVLSTAMAGEYTQTALAQAVGLDKTTMVVAIDELEAAGFADVIVWSLAKTPATLETIAEARELHQGRR